MRAYQKAFGRRAVRWAAAVVLSALFVIGTARAEASPWQELQNAIDRADNGGTIINYRVPKIGGNASPALWIGCVLLGLLTAASALICRKRPGGRRPGGGRGEEQGCQEGKSAAK